MTAPKDIDLTVNGESRRVRVEPRMLLSDVLRDKLGLTGTHVGCEHGVCGACTILIDGKAARSCLMFAVQAEGAQIETVEGLSRRGALASLQREFSAHHALQCGFCTPAMLVIAHDLINHVGRPLTEDEVRDGMSAALCRCTGYLGIIEAVMAASRDAGEATP